MANHHCALLSQAHAQRREFLRQKAAAISLQSAYRRYLQRGRGGTAAAGGGTAGGGSSVTAGGSGGCLDARRRAAAGIIVHFLCELRGMNHIKVAVRRLQRTGESRRRQPSLAVCQGRVGCVLSVWLAVCVWGGGG